MKTTTYKTADDVQGLPEIIGESQRKIVEAFEQVSKTVIEKAENESANIIDEAKHQAQQIAEETIAEAREESASIIAKSKMLAQEITTETERYTSIISDLKQDLDQEITLIIEKIRHDVDLLCKAAEKCEGTISEAGSKMQGQFEEYLKAIGDIKHKLEDITESTEYEPNGVLEGLLEPVPRATPTLSEGQGTIEPMTSSQVSMAETSMSDELFAGKVEIDITPPGNSEPLSRVLNFLSRTPNLQVLYPDGSIGQDSKVTVFVEKPLPLLRILGELASVKEAANHDKGIQLVLEMSNIWRG